MQEGQQSGGDELAAGHVISNRYEIVKRLGMGGMGSVYLAKDQILEGNQVALKVLHSELCRDNDLAKRFLREVQLMHSVNHPNVVRTYDVGRDNEMIYFTMEFVSGTPLDEFAHVNSLDLKTIVQISMQICAALQAIHSSEIIHRDLKPANILVLDDMSIKLTDFGVARPKGSNLTQHNEIIGSVEYMAPEVWLGKGMTPAIDFYSLGVIMYELVTGEVPFKSDQPATLMWMHVKRPPTPPKSVYAEIPAWLNQIILKLLAKTSSDRPKTAGEIITYLGNHASRLNSSATGSFAAVSGDTSTAAAATTGNFSAVGSGTFSTIGSGEHPAVTSEVSPRVRGTRRTGRSKLKPTPAEYARLFIIAALFLVFAALAMDGVMSVVEDLFPF